MKTLSALAVACLALVVAGSSDGSTGADVFCSIVNISLNPEVQACRAQMEDELDTFCRSSCSKQLTQALHDCGDSQYMDIIMNCVYDPKNSVFCREVKENETILGNLNDLCSHNDSCSKECQEAVDNIGCCVKYVDGNFSLAECNVHNCTTIQLNTIKAEALKCYHSHVNAQPSLNDCHEELIKSTISQNETITTSFCEGNCPAEVANLYSECGLSNFASIIQNGCARDERSRYCGNVIHPSVNPEWEVLVDKTIGACRETDCSDGKCKEAIDNIGCCLALDVQVNTTISTLLPLSGCDIQHCQAESFAPLTIVIPSMSYSLFGTLLVHVLFQFQ